MIGRRPTWRGSSNALRAMVQCATQSTAGRRPMQPMTSVHLFVAALTAATLSLTSAAEAQTGKSGDADLLARASAEPGAVVTGSGLVYLSMTEGQGESPAATDVVRVHYRGTFADGREFDSSYGRGQPASFPLNRVIRCWTEGVQKMKIGGKARLTCPSALAYGERGTPGGPIAPNTPLQFEVELLGIERR